MDDFDYGFTDFDNTDDEDDEFDLDGSFQRDSEPEYEEYVRVESNYDNLNSMIQAEHIQEAKVLQEIEKKMEKNEESQSTFDKLFSEGGMNGENSVYESDIKGVSVSEEKAVKANEEFREKAVTATIETHEFIKKEAKECVDLIDDIGDKKKERTYTKEAEMPKANFSKPMEEISPAKKWTMFGLACAVAGVFLGIQANSYYVYCNGKVESTFSCTINWLMETDMPVSVSPFHSDVFATGFFVGFLFLGIIGLLIWADNDAKKASRVGHEHGNAHLAKANDFKTFQNRFMEK